LAEKPEKFAEPELAETLELGLVEEPGLLAEPFLVVGQELSGVLSQVAVL
jgi:hypothetical protein